MNYNFKQLYCGCGCGSFTNDKGVTLYQPIEKL